MSTYTGLEIAIIGMSGKFPGADNVTSFWDNIKNGVESVEFFTPEELLEEGETKELIQNDNYVAANAYLKNKEFFDADFFGYIPDEAKIMDPQMRLFHQVCWEAIEDAGCNLEDTNNKIGLFAGAASNLNWEMYANVINQEGLVDDFSAFQLRNARFLASKISYAFNLKGVSMFVDTACSTSLVAVHQACRSLLVGDCNIAIAGGVTVTSKSKKGYIYQEGMINSKDGHCKTFDAESSGTVGGEGAGVVILKPLKQAIKDRDNIHAIIRGTGVNNDGDNKVGYTAPSIDGQMEAIMTAQKWAKVAPETISYIEAHGTGTTMGDPIEIAALKKAFKTDKKQFCAIGSVKTNIGHLDTASGITGLIKTVMALKNKQLPPSLHYKNPNPAIDFENSPFYVNTALQEWKNGTTPLRAGVSSFGIGGTNAHVVLEEAPLKTKSVTSDSEELLVVSGKTPEALKRNLNNFADYLKTNASDTLADIAYTLKTGRSSLPYRKSVVCNTKKAALELLSSEETLFADELTAVSNSRNAKIAFMFSGQGSQYQNMCADLYKEEPVFKENVDKCLTFLKEKYAKDFTDIIFSNNEETVSIINETENAQPALFTIEYALAKLLISWGIVPEIMIGHSIGEYATACISGVFTLEEALSIVVKRGELMQKMARGSMLSISIAAADLKPILKEHTNISLAAENSSTLCVVSGDDASITSFKELMESKGYTCRDIKTSHAFHSYMMDDMLEEFLNEFTNVNLQKPTIPFVSNLTGNIATAEEVTTAEYWARHLRETVQFSKGIETILDTEQVVLIEVGPGKVLSYLASTHKKKTDNHKVINLVKSIKEEGSDVAHLLTALGNLWEQGVAANWTTFYKDVQRNKVSLPTYDFEKVFYPVNVDAIQTITEKFDLDFVNGHGEIDINATTWKNTLLPNMTDASEKKSDCFLVFSGEENLSESIIEKLTTAGKSVIEVKQGNEFEKHTETSFKVNFQALELLWEELEKAKVKVEHIIYNAALNENVQATDFDAIDARLNSGYIDICSIVKSMPQAETDDEIKITVFNNHTAQVFTGDSLNALKRTVLAPIKVLPSEIVQLRCKLIDISYPFENDSIKENYVQKFINELSFEEESPLVAYRHQQRWVPVYEKFTPKKQLQSSINIVKDGSYLITGGFGGMGFSIAEDLVCNKEANVIIVHRSAFPKRSEWEALLLQEETAVGKQLETIQKIKKLLAMEATGKTVSIRQADISVEAEVKELIENVQKEHSKINGLIWAAGEVDYGGIILNRSKESLKNYCSSKIDGVLLFEKYVDFESLDFVSLFSSIGNVFYQSKFGQVAYNAANEFMETYAAQLTQKLGIHAFAINWCDWLNVGMTVKTIRKGQQTETIENINSQVLHGIYPQEGVDVFYRCLQNKNTSSTILRGDLVKTIAAYQTEYQRRKKEFTEQTIENSEETIETFSSIEEMLTVTFKRFFGKSSIEINDDFFDLGGDSLKGMTITARINQQIGSSLSIADLYKYPTIKLLNEFLSASEIQNNRSEIPKATERENYKVSSAQRRMYFMQSLDKESTAYNETQVLKVGGLLDKKQLKNALGKLIDRHESLRTNFELIDGVITQKIKKENTINIEEFTTSKASVESIVQNFVRPFCLETESLLRFGIITESEIEHIILMDIHHIITDGISNNILIRDFMAFYNGDNLPELKLQYKDYAEWQQSESEIERVVAQKQFWLNEFADETPVLELPLDYQRPMRRSNNGESVEFYLTETETEALNLIAEKQGVSMFMLLLSLYNILLSKVTNQQDIVIGTPTSGRMHADVENMFGMFVNTLPLRNYPKTTVPFTTFLQEVKQKALASFDNQEFQYEDIIEALDIKRDINRDALFDTVFAFRNFEESVEEKSETVAVSGLEFRNYNQNVQTTKFDLKLEASEQSNNLMLSFGYCTDLFKKETLKRFATYFKNIVGEIINNQEIELGAIDILSAEDKKQLLFDFNETKTSYPSTETIDALFAKQAIKTPTKIAVSYNDKELTYSELETRSNQFANFLQSKHNVEKGDIVAILLERSENLPVVILGTLKAGAVYLPLDPAYPEERINLVQSDSNFKTAINQTVLNTFLAEETLNEEVQITVDRSSEDLAYIMYTSGSTGKPKAVMISHKNVVRLVKSANYYDFSATDKLISTGAFSFDATTFEYWGMLLNGGELILCDQDVLLQNNALQNEIRTRKANVMWFTAGWGNQLIDDNIEIFAGLETVLLGGEKLSLKHIQKLRNQYPALQIVNGYGPTENTTFSLTYDIKEVTDLIPIGKPISNSSAYILDKNQQLQPIGVVGEIYLGGDGLAKGYLNDPEKTAEKFVENPFKKGEKIYKSGDLGMWLSDGNIHYMGRNDNQVKIRGHRIELGEIEQVLETQDTIAQVAVTVKTVEKDKTIVAYILPENGTVDKEALKNDLKQLLPEYMVPNHYVEVSEMPLNANGKVDHKALPELQEQDIIHAEYVEASTATEKELVVIWKNLLQVEQIGIKDNFFDLGGHSIKAIKMSHDISTVFELDVSIKNIFVYPTIEQLAAQIEIAKKQQEAITSNTELNEIEI